MTPVKNVQRGIPCCSDKKEALLDVVVVCVWLVVVCCCVLLLCLSVLLCVRVCGCLVVVCRTHSQDHDIHTHKDVHVGVTVILLIDLPQWFHGFLLLVNVSCTFRDFKLH